MEERLSTYSRTWERGVRIKLNVLKENVEGEG